MRYILILTALFIMCQLIDCALNYTSGGKLPKPIDRLMGLLFRALRLKGAEPVPGENQ